VGQQPNMPLRMEDLPRPDHHPPPPRHWSPQRPGDVSSPGESRWGGAFATPGSDSGFALSLLAERESGERDDDTTAALAVLMMARASHFGRAPVRMDADVAEIVLGRAEKSAADASAVVRGVSRSRDRAGELLESVDLGLLTADAERVDTASGGAESMSS